MDKLTQVIIFIYCIYVMFWTLWILPLRIKDKIVTKKILKANCEKWWFLDGLINLEKNSKERYKYIKEREKTSKFHHEMIKDYKDNIIITRLSTWKKLFNEYYKR